MSVEIKFALSDEAQQIMRDLRTAPQWMLAAIAAAMAAENDLTVSHIQEKYLSFPRDEPATELGLRVQSNRLRQSLWASDPVIRGQVVESAIGDNVTSHGVNYAAVHEFGATIPAHKVTAKGKALRFEIGGRVLFRKSVNIPEVTLPARAPIQHGIADRAGAYGSAISDAISKAWHDHGQH
jgi:hypothetical protein